VASRFLHIYIVVKRVDADRYRVSVQYKDTVEKFGPAVVKYYPAEKSFGDFIISKCVLGEAAAFESESFKPLLNSVKKRQLASFRKSFTPTSKK
jgi:hypothetical protein